MRRKKKTLPWLITTSYLYKLTLLFWTLMSWSRPFKNECLSALKRCEAKIKWRIRLMFLSFRLKLWTTRKEESKEWWVKGLECTCRFGVWLRLCFVALGQHGGRLVRCFCLTVLGSIPGSDVGRFWFLYHQMSTLTGRSGLTCLMTIKNFYLFTEVWQRCENVTCHRKLIRQWSPTNPYTASL